MSEILTVKSYLILIVELSILIFKQILPPYTKGTLAGNVFKKKRLEKLSLNLFVCHFCSKFNQDIFHWWHTYLVIAVRLFLLR